MALSTNDMAAMQAEAATFLPDSGTIYRLSGSGTAATLPAHGTAACRVSPIQASAESVGADRELTLQTWMVTFAAGTDVQAADQIKTGGRVFEVVGSQSPRSWPVTTRVIAREVGSWQR